MLFVNTSMYANVISMLLPSLSSRSTAVFDVHNDETTLFAKGLASIELSLLFVGGQIIKVV